MSVRSVCSVEVNAAGTDLGYIERMAAFVGNWEHASAENMEAYMDAMGESTRYSSTPSDTSSKFHFCNRSKIALD